MTRTGLVLGGTGFLGRHICASLISAGWHVLVLSRRSLPGAIRVVLGSDAVHELTEIFTRERPALVVNAAGSAWQSPVDPVTSVNHLLPAALAEAMSRAAVPRLLHLGSALEYAPARHGAVMGESFPVAPQTPYGISKLMGSRALLDTAARAGLDAGVLRVFNAIGPGMPAASLLGKVAATLFAHRSDPGGVVIELDKPVQYRDFVDVRDVARAVALAADAAPGAFHAGVVANIGRGAALHTEEITTRLIEISGVAGRIVSKPRSEGSRAAGLDWQCADIGRAARLFGWRPSFAVTTTVRDIWARATRTALARPHTEHCQSTELADLKRPDPAAITGDLVSNDLKSSILEGVRKFHEVQSASNDFVPGKTFIPPSGAVLDADDRAALVEAALEMRIASGVQSRRFERQFARYFGLRKAHLANSGSSANLLAMSAFTAPELKERRIRPGDEVITVAGGFPTTVNPIVQNGLVPVFVDIDLRTYNTTADRVAAAIGPRTKGIAIAHALGNPFEATEITELTDEHGLWFLEDNCDAVGSRYNGRLTGTFGHISTVSFYPAHHITVGEGGCVLTSDLNLARLVESYRDWGRDCWCEPGEDDRCQRRFGWSLGTLPEGYDHKYTFSHVGYNLKSTDLQSALGLTQLAKLEGFGLARRRNWQRLRTELADLPGLVLPEPTVGSEPSWFGFVITVSPDAGFSRRDLQLYLESRRIGTRLLFSGNLTRHPAYQDVEYRICGNLHNSDLVARNTFWIGVYPGITDEMLDFMISSIRDFVHANKDR